MLSGLLKKKPKKVFYDDEKHEFITEIFSQLVSHFYMTIFMVAFVSYFS